MTMSNSFLDTVYGETTVGADIKGLLASPVVQRLRHIRLSNIDSLDMPGIANLSRYEHVLGANSLVGHLGLYNRLAREDQLAISAAALLHDWAITAFGHLVEEAFRYVGMEFDHESRLHEILVEGDQDEIGGVEKQILYGRQMKLKQWAEKVVGRDHADGFLLRITDYIQGRGKYGRLICGDIDLDNIDGVFRMAVHMGLPVDRECPTRLARAIVDAHEPDGRPVFSRSATADIAEWVSLRKTVYQRLMLADHDFTGKLMFLYATVSALEAGEVNKNDWYLTDQQFLSRLLESPTNTVRDTVTRWAVGEIWHITPLYWMEGPRPDFPNLLRYAENLSSNLSRPCFAYAIRDKRNRLLDIAFEDGTFENFGEDSSNWLFGVGSSMRKPFTAAESIRILEMAQSCFGTSVISAAPSPWSKANDGGNQGWLL